jgi:glutathione S-transferase
MPKDRIERARATAWVFAALNSMEFGIMQLVQIDVFHKGEAWTGERRPQVVAFLKNRLGLLAQALGEKDYLEERFTVGDLMMADVLRILEGGDMLDEFPTLKAYKERCKARPAFRRA